MTGRKALQRDYRDRKIAAGIYAVRCAATAETWVGATPDLSTRRNGIWFSLKHGSHPEPTLQAAWAAHGEALFSFEALEAIDDAGLEALGRAALLKARRQHWLTTLNARGLNR
jgi:hypothetical protein